MTSPQRARMTISEAQCKQRLQGFTYLGLLLLIAVLGLVSGATVQLGALLQRHAAEEALLNFGEEYRAALISYAAATPTGQARRPSSLQDLVRDPRYPMVRRHLRKIYADPITGKTVWGTVSSVDGVGIAGIHSLSEAAPIKVGNFASPFEQFAGQASYREWVFSGR